MVGWDDQMVMNRDGYELLSGIYAYITPEHHRQTLDEHVCI